MKASTLLAVAVLTTAGVVQAEHAHWGYSGDIGPKAWGGLDPEFLTCDAGQNQSPIDLASFVEADVPPILFDYAAGGSEVVNNGHTIQINYAPGSKITLEGRDFELKQFHFHSPSEHLVEGSPFPMEAHLVHADTEGHVAVLGVLFVEGEANTGLDAAWEAMPETPGKAALARMANAEALLPRDRDHYRFSGSLTTPPCSEGVVWLMMKRPVTASKEQIDKFSAVMGVANNRPIQPINARLILK